MSITTGKQLVAGEKRPVKKRKRLPVDESRAKDDYKPFTSNGQVDDDDEGYDDWEWNFDERMAKVKFVDPRYFGHVMKIRDECCDVRKPVIAMGGHFSTVSFEGDWGGICYWHDNNSVRVTVMMHTGKSTPRIESFSATLNSGESFSVFVTPELGFIEDDDPHDVQSNGYVFTMKAGDKQIYTRKFFVKNTPKELVGLLLFIERLG